MYCIEAGRESDSRVAPGTAVGAYWSSAVNSDTVEHVGQPVNQPINHPVNQSITNYPGVVKIQFQRMILRSLPHFVNLFSIFAKSLKSVWAHTMFK